MSQEIYAISAHKHQFTHIYGSVCGILHETGSFLKDFFPAEKLAVGAICRKGAGLDGVNQDSRFLPNVSQRIE